MWAMARSSVALFFKGKLFADPRKVYGQLAIGLLLTATLLVGLAKLGAPFWAAALVAGLVGGGIQPYLFRNLRYR
ncbi:MAG: hypothetical protein ABI906_00910 [Pseudomonadota bacterium]